MNRPLRQPLGARASEVTAARFAAIQAKTEELIEQSASTLMRSQQLMELCILMRARRLKPL